MKKLRWGVLGVAKIAVEKVIPAMQRGQHTQVVAIASRSDVKAALAADRLHIPKAYGSYEALLADPEVDAVYNPLPNHLHVPWSIQALQAGKHVLCEKPIALSVAEAEELAAAGKAHPKLKLMEAFMYRLHPQWVMAKRLVEEGQIGRLQTIQTLFSYHNRDPANVRNLPDIGGGGLMDIGCYGVSLARFMFGAEPWRVIGILEEDPDFRVDRLASAILDFRRGTATFTCGTQLSPYQRVQIMGDEGRVEIEIPFNAPPDRPCRLLHVWRQGMAEIMLNVCDQYTIQAEQFSLAVLHDKPVPTPIEDAMANMKVVEAIVKSNHSGRWEVL